MKFQPYADKFLAWLISVIGEEHMVESPDLAVLNSRPNATGMQIATIDIHLAYLHVPAAPRAPAAPAPAAPPAPTVPELTARVAVLAADRAARDTRRTPAGPPARQPPRPPPPLPPVPQVTARLPPAQQEEAAREATEAVSNLTGEPAANLDEAWL